jgi:hypothetical protein
MNKNFTVLNPSKGRRPICSSSNTNRADANLHDDRISYPWECKTYSSQGVELSSITFNGHLSTDDPREKREGVCIDNYHATRFSFRAIDLIVSRYLSKLLERKISIKTTRSDESYWSISCASSPIAAQELNRIYEQIILTEEETKGNKMELPDKPPYRSLSMEVAEKMLIAALGRMAGKVILDKDGVYILYPLNEESVHGAIA